MSVFLDTNIIAYANDARFPEKQAIALGLIQEALRKKDTVVSTQVLGEFVSVGLGKLKLVVSEVLRQVAMLEKLDVVQVTPGLIRRGIELRQTYGVHFWDGCILAAAEVARCDMVLSEDLNPGQLYAGARVQNPFK